jgi:periplasmic divalent cation tolerance protein
MSTNAESDHGMAVVSAPVDAPEGIAREIVCRKLAACAQVTSPVSSTYWWNGRVETAAERLIILKTRRSLLGGVQDLLRQVHPYEVPELTFVAIAAGGAPYLAWLEETLRT